MARHRMGGWLHYLGVSHFVTRRERHGCVLKRAECLSSPQALSNVGLVSLCQQPLADKPAAAPVERMREKKSELSPC